MELRIFLSSCMTSSQHFPVYLFTRGCSTVYVLPGNTLRTCVLGGMRLLRLGALVLFWLRAHPLGQHSYSGMDAMWFDLHDTTPTFSRLSTDPSSLS
jgi:hypothetical protein